jgi:hypothetical protein
LLPKAVLVLDFAGDQMVIVSIPGAMGREARHIVRRVCGIQRNPTSKRDRNPSHPVGKHADEIFTRHRPTWVFRATVFRISRFFMAALLFVKLSNRIKPNP